MDSGAAAFLAWNVAAALAFLVAWIRFVNLTGKQMATAYALSMAARFQSVGGQWFTGADLVMMAANAFQQGKVAAYPTDGYHAAELLENAGLYEFRQAEANPAACLNCD